jgi:dTDP-4-dehydrorhamnose 3,5-epimerase
METNVEVTPTAIPDVLLVTPRVWPDARGFFLESFNARDYAASGLPTFYVQDNHSRSRLGVLRGLHYQLQKPQGKLVGVIRGRIFDVAADIRRGSPTFGQWVAFVLDDIQREMLWIPPGFAHGFCALSDGADVVYKCTEYYDPASERGVRWDDQLLGIKWPVEKPLVSEKDSGFLPLSLDRRDLPAYELRV